MSTSEEDHAGEHPVLDLDAVLEALRDCLIDGRPIEEAIPECLADGRPIEEAYLLELRKALQDYARANQDSALNDEKSVDFRRYDYLKKYEHLGDFWGRFRSYLLDIGYIERDTRLAPGDTLCDRYVIRREIGNGGMGVVYEAEEVELERKVAVKMVLRDVDGQAKRFHTEAIAAAALHHTNIVPIFYHGEHEKKPFLILQLIEAVSLSQVIEKASDRGRRIAVVMAECRADARRATSSRGATGRKEAATATRGTARAYERRIVEWVLKIAHAIEHARSREVVHRDIKPSNILIDGNDEPWLTDFGLAQVGSGRNADSSGTPRFMSPEQVRGDSDHRTDIYSLGATLYELLALRPAFPGSDPEQIRRDILNVDPVPLRRLAPSTPRDLDVIVTKMMQKQRENRYQSAEELAKDLQCFLDRKPLLTARESTVFERLHLFSRREPWLALFGTLLCVALVISVVTFMAYVRRSSEALLLSGQVAAEAQQRADVLIKSIENAALQGPPESRAYIQALIHDHISAKADADPVRLAEVTGHLLRDVRHLPLLHSLLAWKGSPLRDASGDQLATGAASRFAAVRHRSGIIDVWDADRGKQAALLTVGDERPTQVAVRPDGARLAAGTTEGSLIVWDTRDWRVITRIPLGSPVKCLAYDAEGRRLVCGTDQAIQSYEDGPDGLMHLVGTLDPVGLRAPGGGDPQPSPMAGPQAYSIAPNPDGRLLLGYADGKVLVCDTKAGTILREWDHKPLRSVAWHPQGTSAAIDDGHLTVRDTSNGAVIVELQAGTAWASEERLRYWDRRGYLVTSWGSEVRLRDGRSGSILASHPIEKVVYHVTPSSSGKPTSPHAGLASEVVDVGPVLGGGLAVFDAQGTIRVWSRMPGVDRVSLPGSGGETAVRWLSRMSVANMLDARKYSSDIVRHAPNRSLVALTTTRDPTAPGTIEIREARLGATVRVLRGHQTWVTDLGFSRDGLRVVSGGAEGSVRIWETTGDGPPIVLPVGPAPIDRAAFVASDKRVVAAAGGEVSLWDAATGQCLLRVRLADRAGQGGAGLDAGRDSSATTIRELQSGAFARIAGEDTALAGPSRPGVAGADRDVPVGGPILSNGFLVLGAGTNSPKDTALIPPRIARYSREFARTDHPQRIEIATDADGSVIVAHVEGQNVLHLIYDSGEGLGCSYDGGVVGEPDSPLRSFAITPDGSRLITGHDDGGRVWSVPAGREVLRLSTPSAMTALAAVDKQIVLSGCSDGMVARWDLRPPGRLVSPLATTRCPGPVHHIEASGRDGLMLAAHGDTVHILDLATLKDRATFRARAGRGPLNFARAASVDGPWTTLVYLGGEYDSTAGQAVSSLSFLDLTPLRWPAGQYTRFARLLGARLSAVAAGHDSNGDDAVLDLTKLHERALRRP